MAKKAIKKKTRSKKPRTSSRSKKPNPSKRPAQKSSKTESAENEPVYEMTVDLNVLDHLGINLYSNIAAVLTEAVANAWDADATTVNITIDADKAQIQIEDDGVGMNVEDMNTKYLRVGYRRREEDSVHGKVSASGRKVMGRKGLGKLSLFSIADLIEVQSAKDGFTHGLSMSVPDIKKSVEANAHYHPTPLTSDEVKIDQGTKITLNEVKRKRLGIGVNALRKRLARRFSVIGAKQNFVVAIDGVQVSPADRGDLSLTQFLWKIGSFDEDISSLGIKESVEIPDRLDAWDDDRKISGWIGTARKPKHLDTDDVGNLNSIVVFSRGRLFHENILDKVNDGRLFTKYLTGQLEADFLDDDSSPDIATSDRQRIQEDDERYLALLAFLKSSLNKIESQWSEWRVKHEVNEAIEEIPILNEWLNTLPGGHQRAAKTLIAKLSALPIDSEDERKILYKHGILAFERMKLRGAIDDLINSVHDIDKLLAVLADQDILEATLYRDIVMSRLEIINKFQDLVDVNDKEKVLQQYLFDHLWLLDPAWERATDVPAVMESRLIEEGIITDDMTEKERLGRVDIAYRCYVGKHVIVELKRAGRKVTLIELQEQGQLYVDKLKKILVQQNESNPNIEVIFIIGTALEEDSSNPDRIKHSMNAISAGSRISHYDALIAGAQNQYADYLAKTKEIDKLQNIIDRI